MAGWAFFQLRTFLTYKAKLAGVALALVDPSDTSRTCSVAPSGSTPAMAAPNPSARSWRVVSALAAASTPRAGS